MNGLLGVSRASRALAVSALAIGSAHFDVGGWFWISEGGTCLVVVEGLLIGMA